MPKPVIPTKHQSDCPKVGIGGCLLGQPVRYTGGHKKSSEPLQQMQQVMDLVGFCPEVAIGLGVPRDPIRLVASADEIKAMDSDKQQQNYTQPLQNYAGAVLDKHPDLAGYILVKGSPSCGYERVKLYNEQGTNLPSRGVGIYAQQLMHNDPLLPVEEDGRLHDTALRENFIRRIYAYHDWKKLAQAKITHRQLIDYYSRYKYLVMAHQVAAYKAIGQLLAQPNRENPQQQAQQLITLLMTALKHKANRKGYSNALFHVKGYLKHNLNSGERVSLDDVIEQYRTGVVPLVVPITLLKHYFTIYPNEYIAQQVLLLSYPDVLGLHNQIS